MRRTLLWIVTCALLSGRLDAQTVGHQRALLIGINDYTATHVSAHRGSTPAPGRDWPNLNGPLNDVAALEEMLVLIYGFDRRDIVTLTNQNATRSAILTSLERHLVRPAAKDDVLLFYYAGHGSQVRNSKSTEPDQLDESIIPADSRVGAPDIRDKELRLLFNRILDRGARLTILLDNCHSGSGARGLPTGARPRGVKPDPRDVADGNDYGPRPESHGALVVTASQDSDSAWDIRDAQGQFHGAFSWAWIRAIRDSTPGESAMETFLRAAARLHTEMPFQDPVISGNPREQHNPFLGARTDRRANRAVVAVEKVLRDGTIVLQGGWANGLAVGSQLQIVGARTKARLTVTALQGLGQSSARMEGRMPPAIKSGALLEIVGWAAPPGRPLRVWMPRASESVGAIVGTARALAAAAARRGVRWVSDPIDVTPTHVLRRGATDWELLVSDGVLEHIGDDNAAIAAVAKMPAGSSLFVQLPAPAALIAGISVGSGTEREDFEPTRSAEDADYVLVGRYSGRHLAYSWMRPLVKSADRRKTGLPLSTQWFVYDESSDAMREAVLTLREAVLRLRKIFGWNLLESPPDARWPYRLAMRRTRTGELVKDPVVIGDDEYELVLLGTSTPMPATVQQRYIYAFIIDSDGRSVVLFPEPDSGSVENRFPLPATAASRAAYPPTEIRLGKPGSFEVTQPYGVDTYFLLSTDEPLQNPSILEWDGVRSPTSGPRTALEQLLMLTGTGSRATPVVTPSNWSIERLVVESVPPRTKNR